MNNLSIRKIVLSIGFLAFFTLGNPAAASERLALVIGNGDYKDSPLKNPRNDAEDVSAMLTRFGFSVTHITDGNQRSMESQIREFTRKIDEETIGLFYFAGHAVQVDGQNYLIPVEAQIEAQEDVRYESVPLGRVIDGMNNSRGRLNLIILDACRNNPYSSSFRSNDTGLARSSPASGTMIMYATEPGAVAADGEDRNGVFTGALLDAIEEDNSAGIETLFKRTSAKVNSKTGGSQSPWSEGIIYGDFAFAEPLAQSSVPADNTADADDIPVAVPESNAPITRSTTSQSSNLDALMWQSAEKYGDLVAYKAYAEAFPNGIFIRLAEISIRRLEAEQQQLQQEQARLAEQERLKLEEQQRLEELERQKRQEEIDRLAREEKRKQEELERQIEQARLKKEEQQRLAAIREQEEQERLARQAEKKRQEEQERLARQAEEKRQEELETAAREQARQRALQKQREEQALKQAAAQRALEQQAIEKEKQARAEKALAAAAEDAAERLKRIAWVDKENALKLKVSDRIRVQLVLNAQGIHVGSADGQWGPRTRAGIQQWQADKGHAESGYLDQLTYKALLADVEPTNEPAAEEFLFEPPMVSIPSGTFLMGTKKWLGNARPAREVTIDGFELSKFEITFEQFDAYVKDARIVPPDDRDWGRGKRPVINVTWEEAKAYVAWLSKKTGKAYRLASEAEWEYAARAGSTTSFSFSNSDKQLCEYGNSKDVSCDGYKFTAPVGSFKPNDYGLYDMHGNVGEWVEDCWHANYKGAPTTAEPWIENGRCGTRVLRGGAWSNSTDNLRSFSRIGYTTITRLSSGGIRVAR